jgi:hypothetical protein
MTAGATVQSPTYVSPIWTWISGETAFEPAVTLTLALDGKAAGTLSLDGHAAGTLTLDGKAAGAVSIDALP